MITVNKLFETLQNYASVKKVLEDLQFDDAEKLAFKFEETIENLEQGFENRIEELEDERKQLEFKIETLEEEREALKAQVAELKGR